MYKLTGNWCLRATVLNTYNIYVELKDTTGLTPKYWRKASKDEISQLNIMATHNAY